MYTIIDDKNLKNIATAIRKKAKIDTGLRPQDMSKLIEGLRCVGDEVDCLKYANSFTFSEAVAEVTDDIDLYVENATSLASMAEYTTFSCNKISLHFSDKLTNLTRAFRYTKGNLKEIEIIGDTKNVAYW